MLNSTESERGIRSQIADYFNKRAFHRLPPSSFLSPAAGVPRSVGLAGDSEEEGLGEAGVVQGPGNPPPSGGRGHKGGVEGSKLGGFSAPNTQHFPVEEKPQHLVTRTVSGKGHE